MPSVECELRKLHIAISLLTNICGILRNPDKWCEDCEKMSKYIGNITLLYISWAPDHSRCACKAYIPLVLRTRGIYALHAQLK